jgi:hypothetical protein
VRLILGLCLSLLEMLPAAAVANKHYVVNREPLQQTAFVHLPPGAVRPRGWLADQLRVRADGQTSYLWSAFACASADANPPYHQEGVVTLALVLGEHKRLNALAKGYVDRRLGLPTEPRLTFGNASNRLPSGLKATMSVDSPPPAASRVRSLRPVRASHSTTFWSQPAEASHFPSGLNVRPRTQFSPWPRRVSSCSPLAVSKTRTAPSWLAEASRLPSGRKTTSLTGFEWPLKVRGGAAGAVSCAWTTALVFNGTPRSTARPRHAPMTTNDRLFELAFMTMPL